MRGALYAAWAEMRVAEESNAERFVAHLTKRVSAGSAFPIFRWRRLSAVEGCHGLAPKNVSNRLRPDGMACDEVYPDLQPES